MYPCFPRCWIFIREQDNSKNAGISVYFAFRCFRIFTAFYRRENRILPGRLNLRTRRVFASSRRAKNNLSKIGESIFCNYSILFVKISISHFSNLNFVLIQVLYFH